jgi:drug/metabolite transporter (DMT)-like permease
MAINLERYRSSSKWMFWTALWTVYLVWGSTYLAIRVAVETLPPFLHASVRFLLAGAIMYAFLRIKDGRDRVRVTPREVGASAIVGTALLLGGNGLVALGEQTVPSGLAALIIASVPLWVILLRAITRDRVTGGTLIGTVVGFAGVALLVFRGDSGTGATIGGVLLIVLASISWASGSFFSGKLSLPKDPFVSTAIQMLSGGVALGVVALGSGEIADLQPSEFSLSSLLAVAYLVVFGSLAAFTAYTWLLQNAPISKVATYAYVNPVVAVFLGWLILSETITGFIIAGATLIVASVAFIVRHENAKQQVARAQQELEVTPVPAAAGVEN